jgi:predicted acetyltransferase
MLFREAKSAEINLLFQEGYKEWSKNRTFEQYCIDNAKEDAYGTRYVLEVNGEIVSSTILLKLKDIHGKRTYGIGSVLTPKIHAGNGYATELLKNCLRQIYDDNTLIFLYSDINPSFYERFDFKILPPHLQKYQKSPCMVYCKDNIWHELLAGSKEIIPDYF